MSEIQFWHIVATSAVALLVMIVGFYGARTAKKVDDAMTRDEFKEYMERAETARREFRDNQIKMFERLESHGKADADAFATLSKDFNTGLTLIRETVSRNHIEVIRELNGKADKGRR